MLPFEKTVTWGMTETVMVSTTCEVNSRVLTDSAPKTQLAHVVIGGTGVARTGEGVIVKVVMEGDWWHAERVLAPNRQQRDVLFEGRI